MCGKSYCACRLGRISFQWLDTGPLQLKCCRQMCLTLCTGIASLESELSSDDNNLITFATFGISISTTERNSTEKNSTQEIEHNWLSLDPILLFFNKTITAAGTTRTKFIAALLRSLLCSTAGQDCSLAINQLLTNAGLMELWRVSGFYTSNAGLTLRMWVTWVICVHMILW